MMPPEANAAEAAAPVTRAPEQGKMPGKAQARWGRAPSAWAVGLCALVVRLAVVFWADGHFPPAADGFYYDTIARRVARGLGYTWLWPDGAVTYAAHYPIGYPAIIGLAYRWFGPSVFVAGIVNALLGAAAAVAAYTLARDAESPSSGRPAYAATLAGLAVAIHPGIAAYTPAIMTEGVTAALWIIAAAAAARARRAHASGASGARWVFATGILLGGATLVRPQSLLLAPFFGALAVRATARAGARVTRGALVTAIALGCCLPWTARNCVRMKRCALVSVNGGWNLLIGAAPNATGVWSPVEVPPACREVWGEADKDVCFGRAAVQMIATRPRHWLSLVPAKLAGTFDYCGAAGYYLHASNAGRFDDRAKRFLGSIETIYERFAYLGALLAAAIASGPRRRWRVALAAVGVVLLFQPHAYLSVLLLALALLLLGGSIGIAPILYGGTGVVVAATAATHAIFFGAGRYGMVVFPFVTALAACGAVEASAVLRALSRARASSLWPSRAPGPRGL